MNKDISKLIVKLKNDTINSSSLTFEELRDLINDIKTELDESRTKDLRNLTIKIKNDLDEIFELYHKNWKDYDWNTCCYGSDCCCRGMPTDPEYYIYQSIKELESIVKGKI